MTETGRNLRLAPETIANIRERHAAGEPQSALRVEFGLSAGTMSRLCGASYKRATTRVEDIHGTASALNRRASPPVQPQTLAQDIESWASIPDFSAVVSSHGRVYSMLHEKLLRPGVNSAGYPQVVLTNRQKRVSLVVHRLVASAFVVNPEPSIRYQVNHIDSVRTNDFYKNLEWVTAQGNTDHAEQRSPFWAPRVGSGRFNAKLTEADVMEIRKLYKAGIGPTNIAAKFGVHQSNVSNIVAGRSWRHVPDETTP